jgi:hypothetical protein
MAAKQITWWQKFGNAAQIAAAAISICGFVAILFQINELRSNSRAASARQAYLGYMDMAFKNPSFTVPDFDKIKAAGKDELTRYEVFVNYFLYSCEEAMTVLAGKQEWHDACELDLKPHLAFLCEKMRAEPRYLSTFAAVTQDLVKSAMLRYGVAQPDCKVRKT